MNKIFNMNGKLFQALSIIADLAIVNIIWLICSIPLVTLGASTAALYYSVSLIVKNEDTQLVKSFFYGFKTYWKKASLFFLITIAIIAVLVADIHILSNWFDGIPFLILQYVIYLVFLIFLCIALYFGPVLVQFHLDFKTTIKNSFLLSISHLPVTIVIAIVLIAPIVYCLNDLNVLINFLPFFISFGGSGFTYLSCLLLKQPFTPYLKDEINENNEE